MIADCVKKLLRSIEHPTVIQLGACDGSYTRELFECCRKPCLFYAFEPDPRNSELCRVPEGVELIRGAVGNVSGMVPFHLCAQHPNGDFGSSSLSPFKDVAKEFPWCKEVDTVFVPCFRLDDLCPYLKVDLIFMDIQGAERLMIDGARQTLAKTKWLWTEFDGLDVCLGFYEHSSSLKELKEMLSGWEVVEVIGGDALFRNTLCP